MSRGTILLRVIGLGDFGAKAASYVDTFMEAIRWGNADHRFSELAKGTT
ncbi:MAG TPA: hypothetical protein VNZ48_21050 [Xanthobacteraceae bacterium]|nr:hypothetical protein [Xanthobacteraceae bacterium]